MNELLVWIRDVVVDSILDWTNSNIETLKTFSIMGVAVLVLGVPIIGSFEFGHSAVKFAAAIGSVGFALGIGFGIATLITRFSDALRGAFRF